MSVFQNFTNYLWWGLGYSSVNNEVPAEANEVPAETNNDSSISDDDEYDDDSATTTREESYYPPEPYYLLEMVHDLESERRLFQTFGSAKFYILDHLMDVLSAESLNFNGRMYYPQGGIWQDDDFVTQLDQFHQDSLAMSSLDFHFTLSYAVPSPSEDEPDPWPPANLITCRLHSINPTRLD
jgi:hypothetical protein